MLQFSFLNKFNFYFLTKQPQLDQMSLMWPAGQSSTTILIALLWHSLACYCHLKVWEWRHTSPGWFGGRRKSLKQTFWFSDTFIPVVTVFSISIHQMLTLKQNLEFVHFNLFFMSKKNRMINYVPKEHN